jgi:hypothetical protein
LEDAKPPATKENIEAAKADAERVQTFLTDFKKAFAPFPVAAKVDDRGFVEHLQLTLRQFTMEATNAGVQLPPDCSFGFSQQRGKVSFPAECLGPWMQEMEDIGVILKILCAAKINYLEQIQRTPACQDDISDDCLGTLSTSNQLGVIAPYKVTFRGFSTEVAAVLSGFAGSSNCFLVKYVNVAPSRAALPQVVEEQPQPQMQMQERYMPQSDFNNPFDEGGGRGRRGPRRSTQQQQGPMMMVPQPVAPTPPQTVLQEIPLYVTIVVDAVKLNK